MIKEIQLNSIITCPDCGFKKVEIMPTDSCQFFYECTNCAVILKPKPGDCWFIVHTVTLNVPQFKRQENVSANETVYK
jgi:hypothetical protein